mmetsp:Transcript_10806/g.49837  ORF Transcript_10806/g.49837 Transcript_10806/m.49837 type:complete len:265 (+) Transcript_10806:566-1360(+)
MSTRGISRSCLSASGNLSNRSNASAKSSDPITTQKMARRASVFIRSPLAFCRSSAPSCAAAAAAVELACLSSAPCAALAANHASVPAASGSHHWPLCLDSSIRRSWVSALSATAASPTECDARSHLASAAGNPHWSPPSAPPAPAPAPWDDEGTFISFRSAFTASSTSFLCSLRRSASSVVHVIWSPSLAMTSLELSCHAASPAMIAPSCPGFRSRPTGQECTSNARRRWSSLPRTSPGAMHSLMSMSSSSRTLDISSAAMSSS